MTYRETVDLSTPEVIGDLAVSHLNGGTGATGTTFWRGDGSWAVPAGAGDVTGPSGATTTAIAVYNGSTGKIIQNSIPTIDSNGNLLTSASLSGSTLSIDAVNSSNTANSSARHSVTVAGSSGGDALFQAGISGGQTWSWGCDNSDSDAWALSSNVALGTSNAIRVSTAGEINYPLQPSFLAYMNTAVTNVTGDATVYTIIYDTEVYDQNSDYNLATGTFTAPVTGNYRFDLQILLAGGTSITAGQMRIVSSAATYNRTFESGVVAGTTSITGNLSVTLPMTAGDTCLVQVLSTDSGGKVDDVSGVSGSLRRNWCQGILVN